MTIAEQQPPLRDLDPHDIQHVTDDARRAGITQFQVLALVRPRDAREYVLLVDRRPDDDVWSVPVAWVHPTETVALTLDWLCDRHLGLASWRATLATTAVHRTADDDEVLQIAFDVTVPADGGLSWPGRCQWWHLRSEPPTLHRLARPLLERLQAAAQDETARSA
ncbi:hypothetical protein [Streptacidiphilus anmyonensis]|uniref:hypothetical protein n=1 Tax=Streptacidiphilus anmyonensis TaxID=405782 RepID=UPI0005A66476|nr:hypothetical protein [Streptacidiphilus anmyonensis]